MACDDLEVAKAILVRLRYRLESAECHRAPNDVFEAVVSLVKATRPGHFVHACMSVFLLVVEDDDIRAILGDKHMRELVAMAVQGAERMEAAGKRRFLRKLCCCF